MPAGEYTIRELKPLGFEQTYPTSGEHVVTLAPGEVSPGHDFGNRENDSQIEGLKWHDLNGNGQRDPGEPGLSGIQIYVDANQNGQRDSGELRLFTRADNPDTAGVDETGTFSLAGPNPVTKLPPGTYHIREALNNQYTPTFPNADGLHVIELRPGETEYLEFGNKDTEQVTPGEIHGWKWYDANGNGVWDDGEKGIAGVQIFVDSNDNGIRDLGERRTFTMSDDPGTTEVDETGMFWISNLLPGDYRVREVVPAGFVQTFPPAGFHDVTLRNGETREGLLFGNREAEQPELGGIHGTKWVDWNGDGIWDSEEPGWAGVVIYLDANGNGQRDDSEVWTLTIADNPETMELDETGMYWFDGLLAGNYVVREETPEDSYQTWPLEQQDYEWRVDLLPGQVATERDFGNWPDPEVSGTKWNDLDGDGAWDDNEPPMGDVRIYADLDDDGEWDQDSEPSTSTAGDGTYTLSGLPPGEYSIREVQRDGFVQTYPGNGWPIEVFPELSFDGLNFGNHEGFGGVIQGTKYDDRSGILGQRDADDVDWGASGYAPITIYIDRNNNGEFDEGERSVETNATGGYTFVGLESGTHIVREVLEEGFAVSEPAEGFYEVTVAAGQVIRGKDFGNFEYQAIEDGDDIVFAGAGEDHVWGDNLMTDPRVLSEGTRSDELHGEDGPDILHGQEADDLIWGDTAFGTAYKDTLDGGDGDDRVLQSTDAATQLLSNSELTGQGPDELVDSAIEHATLLGGDSANTLDASQFTLGAVELRGGAGDDQLIATDFDDILHGGDDADSLQAGLGNDELNGGNGDDVMSGDDGDDRYTFDTALSSESDTITESDLSTGGVDTLDFSPLGSSDPVDIDLVAGIGLHMNRAFVFTNPQYLENVTGGNGDDIIRGSIANNVLIGGPGNDQLDGEAGDDLISGGLGADSMQGGTDDDTFLFDTDPVAGELIEDEDGIDALDLSALSHHWQVDIDADEITFSDYLSAVPDIVLGSIAFTTENSLERIVTGAGDERLNVRAEMAGGAGTFESGTGTDEIAYSSFATPVTVSLLNEIATGFASVTGFENVVGSPFTDSLEGNALSNTIRTGGGADSLAGLEGDDHYVLDSAPDGTSTTVQVLELVGEGTDTLDLANAITGAVVDMDNAPNVEVVIGTSFDDTIIANASSILLDGGLGHDVYRFEELDAEVTIVESLASEGGSDWLDFFPFTTSVYVDLAESTHSLPNAAGMLTVHIVAPDDLPTASIENVLGGLRGDVLIGNDGDNTLLGSNGDDQIYGKRGRDVLSGGIGANDLYGGADDDIYQFDNSLPTLLSTNTLHEDTGVVGLGLLALGGRDTLDFSAFTTGVTFDLSLETNIVGNHTIRLHDGVPVYDENGVLLSESSAAPEHFEILLGSTTGGNVLQGNAAENLIVGGDEADDLQGRAGTDVLLGMAGADLLAGGSERDVLVGGIGTDELNGGDHQDVLIGGSTQYDSPLNRRALELLLQAWVEKIPYADRVDRLEAVGVDDGAANYRFELDATVFSDLETDVLTGGDRLDWFFGTETEAMDIQPNEKRSGETS